MARTGSWCRRSKALARVVFVAAASAGVGYLPAAGLSTGPSGVAAIVGSKHDLSSTGGSATYRSDNVGEVCVFFHTPHQPNGTTNDPLWNHAFPSTASYGVYGSTTLNATPSIFGGSSMVVSALCMSCHDGTVAVGTLYRKPGGVTPSNSTLMITGGSLMGVDLGNDHPINFTYDAALVTRDGELHDPTIAPISWWLVSGMMQCSSCHNVHDATNPPFLRISNARSALCITCHMK